MLLALRISSCVFGCDVRVLFGPEEPPHGCAALRAALSPTARGPQPQAAESAPIGAPSRRGRPTSLWLMKAVQMCVGFT